MSSEDKEPNTLVRRDMLKMIGAAAAVPSAAAAESQAWDGGRAPQGDSALHAAPLRHADVPEGTLRMKNTPTRGVLAAALAFVLVVFTGHEHESERGGENA